MSLTRSSSGSQIILPSTSPRPGSAQGYRSLHDVHLDSQHQVKSQEVPKEFLSAEAVPEVSKTKKSLYAVGRQSSSVPDLHRASQTSSQSHTASQTSSLNPTVKDKSIPSLPKKRERRNSSETAHGAVQAAVANNKARPPSLDVSDQSQRPGTAQNPFEQSQEETLREQVLAGMKSPRRATAREGEYLDDDVVWDGKKPVFDFCTLRTWFMEMDTEKDGCVSKQGFLQFFRDRPPLRRLLMYAGQVAFKEKMEAGSRKGSKEASAHYTRQASNQNCTAKEAEALIMRRLLRLLKAIDEDGSGTIEWDEFVEFWRKAGFLLEYETKDNPREQIADLLGQIHDDQSDGAKADESVVQRLEVLGKTHLSTQQFARAANNSQSSEAAGAPSMASRMSLPPLQMTSQGAMVHRKSYLTPFHRQRMTIQ